MKNLFLLLALVAGFFTAKAQNKPTKEETIRFINKTINECKGFKLPGGWGNLNSAIFSENELVYNTTAYSFSGSDKFKLYDIKSTYQDLRWDKLDINSLKLQENKVFYYDMEFTSNYSTTVTYYNYWNGNQDENKNYFESGYLKIFIPQNKSESIKKAILRLVEIAMEENKDPFKD